MKLSQDTIQEIQNRIEIEEVVSDFVSLKRKGQNLWACCPFHQEKSPSFSVSPAKGIFKCFGCGKAGDAITFVMEIEALNYVEALKFLAGKYSIEIEEEEQTDEQQAAHNEKESLHIVLGFAARYFQDILRKHPEGKSIGYSYFKQRGFSDQVIEKFGLGYSLEEWDGLMKAAKAEGFSEELLEKAGLVIRKDDKQNGDRFYDRFRGRVIFPIHTVSGKPIAFGARILKQEKTKSGKAGARLPGPKYLNSPETAVYHKSDVLYGISQAKQAIRQHENCYLVEGYTDVISLHLCGVENVVASSGTSLTDGQIQLIGRYAKQITVLFDGDPAGLKASLRGIDMILASGLHVKVVVFPEGEDPDSYSQKLGSTAFQEYLQKEAQDFLKFKTALYAKEAANDPIRKAETVKEVVASIAKIPDPIERAVYLKECSSLLQISEELLVKELNQLHRKKLAKEAGVKQLSPPPEEETPSRPVLEKATTVDESLQLQERESIRLLLNYGFSQIEENFQLHDYLLQEIEELEFQTPIYKAILQQFKDRLAQGQVVDAQFFIREGAPELREEVAGLIVEKYDLSNVWTERHNIHIPREEDVLDKAVFQNVVRLKFRTIQKLIGQNLQKLKEASEEEDMLEFMQVHQSLKNAEMELAKLLGIVVSK
ncbi:DNA primase [Nafulsella turpanensis]|uniref:DNA primase n=1 Tax=Nafulsella turpanensis TaxID=1265690 RepID=UPI000349E429|nr:DNA primase [Nafulsella turpanensis]